MIRTHPVYLFPIPVARMVIQSVVSVTVIHLFRRTTLFISCSPAGLNTLAMSPSDIARKIERITVLAIILVCLEMELWNQKFNATHSIHKIGEVLPELVDNVDAILTSNIVCCNYVLHCVATTKSSGQGIVGIRISSW